MAAPLILDSWDKFLPEFTNSLNNPEYVSKYPEYAAEVQALGGAKAEQKIIDKLLDEKHLDPQEGLNQFIAAVLGCTRRAGAWALRGYVSGLLGAFLDKDAVPDLAPIFEPTNMHDNVALTETDTAGGDGHTAGSDWWEIECRNYEARGVLLDGIAKGMAARGRPLALPRAVADFDFLSIDPSAWDDVGEGISFEKARMMVLKEASSFLGGPRPPIKGGRRRRTRRRGRSARRSRRKSSRGRRRN